MRFAGVTRWLRAARWIHRHHGISPVTLMREYRRFHDAIAVDRVEFLNYWLWDVRRPIAERMAIFSDREHYLLDAHLNSPARANEIRNKARTTARLAEAGVPTGEVLALLTLDASLEAPTSRFRFLRGEAAARALLAETPDVGIVLKPERGRGGESVHVFRTAGPEGLVHLDGTHWSVEEWLRVLHTGPLWKVERRIIAHPVLTRVMGESLGTLRLVTITTLDGVPHLCPAVWKIPVGRSGVDHYNYGGGSYAAEIDLTTGLVGKARRWWSLQHIESHPETRASIVGVQMPHWAATVACALRVAECLPEVATLGLDMAITTEGPVLIEVNTNWGQNLTQAPGPTGLVQGTFRRFLEERGAGSLINLAART
jgi:hypothetical protein